VKISLAELAQSLVITDCNGNGIEGDVAHVNPYGGFVEESAQVHVGATIANGARVCGSSIINSPDVFIEGVDTIVDDSEIGDELVGNYYYINNSLIRSSKLYGDGQKYIVNSDIRDTNAFGQIFMSNAITINSSLEADVFYYPRFDWYMGISIDGGQVIDSKILGVTLVKGIANGARLVRGQTPREIFYQNGSLDGLYNLHIFTSGAVENDASLVGWGGLEGSVKNGAFASMVARRNERGSFEGGVIRKGAALSGASSSASGNFRIESGTLIGTIGNNQGWSPDTGFYSLDQNN